MFLDEVEKISKIIKTLIKQKKIKIVSHYDTDGLTSASIFIKMLLRENVNFELRIVKQLTEDSISDLNTTEEDLLILLDLGSGQLNSLKRIIDITHVLILDHHEPVDSHHLNLFHLNPLTFKFDEISTSMICYLFAKSIDIKNTDLIDLAIVGAVADEQDEEWKFEGLARKILKEAENLGKISIVKGMRLYGRNTRPIHKSLEYSFDPFIPGISGSESNAVQFLSELGINLRTDNEWRKLKDLTIEEQKKLASAIIMERLKFQHEDAANVFGEIYTLLGYPEEIQDVREFATLLNACGRTQNSEIAIRICLSDFTALNSLLSISDKYRKMISDSINWIRDGNIDSTNSTTYIFGKNKIPETLIGTITSIVLNSNIADLRKPLIGFAETENGKIKISARAARNLKVNLRDILVKAVMVVGGEAGGHKFAAGALISKEKQEEFIRAIGDICGEKS